MKVIKFYNTLKLKKFLYLDAKELVLIYYFFLKKIILSEEVYSYYYFRKIRDLKKRNKEEQEDKKKMSEVNESQVEEDRVEVVGSFEFC